MRVLRILRISGFQGSTIAVPFGATPRFVKKVGLWTYPAGGSPTASFRIPGDVELVGATVSVSK